VLPTFYFLFCLAYAGLVAAWVTILMRKRAAVFRIHYFMLVMLVLKGLSLLVEAEDKSYIERCRPEEPCRREGGGGRKYRRQQCSLREVEAAALVR
jgi:hypothetical protein